jgi:cytochrome c oxidase subunit 3
MQQTEPGIFDLEIDARVALIQTQGDAREPVPSPETAQDTSLGIQTGQLGLWAFLATVVMLFAGFASAIFVRRAGGDWREMPLPDLLWINTAVLIASSITIELARSIFRRGRFSAARIWLATTAALGALFVAGQLIAWRQMVEAGFYLPTSPHSSFFFILTGLHAAHLLGGLSFLGYLVAQRVAQSESLSRRIDLCSTYWHFVDGLWVCLLAVLFFM